MENNASTVSSGNIKIHVLQCGSVLVDEALPVGSRSINPWAYTGFFRSSKHKILLPVFAFLIEHPKGLVLVDTGWNRMVRSNPQAALNGLHLLINKPYLPEGQAIDEQLAALGYRASDLDYVLLTHLDTDHAGGLEHVRDAKRILVNETEWMAANRFSLRYLPKMWKDTVVQPIHLGEAPYGPQHLAYDVFSDHSVWMVALPGHSDGMTGILVQHNAQFVLMTSDCAYTKAAWIKMLYPGLYTHKEQLTKSLEWVYEMYREAGCTAILASHDRLLKPCCIEI